MLSSRDSEQSGGRVAGQWRFTHVRDPRYVCWRTFSLANAQVPLSRLGTGERCAVVSDGDRCRAHGCAAPALWSSYHRAYPVDTPEGAAQVIPWGHMECSP